MPPGNGTKRTNAGSAGSQPKMAFDLGAEAVGGLLTALNSPGRIVGARGATAATPGRLVSNAGARAQSQQSFNLANADRQKVYNEASSEVMKQAPVAQANFDANTATMQADARSRAIANQASLAKSNGEASQAAVAMGLPSSPSATTRTAQILSQASAAGQANADSRARFNTSLAGTTGRRISRTSAAFQNESAEQLKKLSEALAAMIAKKGDYMTGGSRGRSASAGKLVGAPTIAQQISGYGKLLSYSGSDFNNDLKAAKYVDSKGGSASTSRSSGRKF